MAKKKIVLAYSGGLDTSVILKWLQKNYDADIVAYAADVGLEHELDGLEEKARKTGAASVHILDLKEEFVRDYVFRALKAGAVYEDQYLLGTSLARPLIAKHQVDVARKEGAWAVSHGATGKGNDQVRFELTFKALAPDLVIIAPWRTWDFKSRTELIAFAQENGIPVPATVEKPYSMDKNCLHISYEGGVLEDPWNEPRADMFLTTANIESAPDTPEEVAILFEAGMPVSVNGTALSPYNLLKTLNEYGGRHGIGRVDIVENRLVGIKSRGVYETPGGTLLWQAHRQLETLVLDRATMHFKQHIALKYAEMAYNGEWFCPLKQALDAFIDTTQEKVTGEVRLRLHKGNMITLGRRSKYSMYNAELATFEKETVYNQRDAEGFINLFGLQIKYAALRDRASKD
ncbi:MAG: argininosuccinate synthase [Spirochaetota bacterium]|jgi:argininosuccinate synthase|nr:argininosuccinate synthase [Spirochaetota bacterium]